MVQNSSVYMHWILRYNAILCISLVFVARSNKFNNKSVAQINDLNTFLELVVKCKMLFDWVDSEICACLQRIHYGIYPL